jgi:hypothetical protein
VGDPTVADEVTEGSVRGEAPRPVAAAPPVDGCWQAIAPTDENRPIWDLRSQSMITTLMAAGDMATVIQDPVIRNTGNVS